MGEGIGGTVRDLSMAAVVAFLSGTAGVDDAAASTPEELFEPAYRPEDVVAVQDTTVQDTTYDFNDNDLTAESYSEIQDKSYPIVSRYRYRDLKTGKSGESASLGSMTPIANKDGRTYFLTVYHAFNPLAARDKQDIEMEMERVQGIFYADIDRVTENSEMSPLQFEFGNKKHDLAVVSAPSEGDVETYLAEEEKLKPGNTVRGVGYTLSPGELFPDGIAYQRMLDGIVTNKNEEWNFSSLNLSEGESGEAVWVFDDGKPLIGGVHAYIGYEKPNGGIRFRMAKAGTIEEFLEGNGFDVDDETRLIEKE